MSRNRLDQETSPYLLQHKDNPVHWWAWGPQALDEAKRTGKPILLSVGYAACHWCHVMAHESFEDEPTAAVMNELFINIKVDREERPDIDAIYMGALHSLGEHGGWPLTMFLDSEARPFWGGTYFPKEQRFGKPAFVRVLQEVARLHHEEPDKIAGNARAILAALAPDTKAEGGPAFAEATIRDVLRRLLTIVDTESGGIKGAPKFPQYSFFWLLWRAGVRFGDPAARQAVTTTLANICQGGIYDHLGGGFARYSVDDRWLVPHFEKMLYDNALLLELMVEVYRETQDPLLRVRAEETVAWLEREMMAAGGAFAASLDADSEGEEGKFYVWSQAEVLEVLGETDGRRFADAYDITPGGNFEGHNIPNRLHRLALGGEAEEKMLTELRAKLMARRGSRVRPGWDDKVLADWNGLMVAALARAARVFRHPEWLKLAAQAYGFVRDNMAGPGDRLIHAFRAGQAKAPASASDYANMVWAGIRLHEATSDASYLADAVRWTATLDQHHWMEPGGYAQAADDTADVIVRLRSANDDATPNANAIMCTNLVHLTLLTGEQRYLDRAEALFRSFAGAVGKNLVAHTGLLAARLDVLAPQHVVIIGADAGGKDEQSLGRSLDGISLPGALEQCLPDAAKLPPGSPLSGKQAIDGKPTAYACLGPQCSLPVTETKELVRLLKSVRERPNPSA
jgi:hypothetical protein